MCGKVRVGEFQRAVETEDNERRKRKKRTNGSVNVRVRKIGGQNKR
jgi:hypothetical protein